MVGIGLARKPGIIAVMLDGHLSRERLGMLTRVINSLRTFTTVELIGEKTTEDQLVQKLSTKNYDLVLVPWHCYLAWSKAEAFWGLTRTSGPALAGYFCDHLKAESLEDHIDYSRAILLDFANLTGAEIGTLVRALQKDTLRSGIRPLVDPDTKIYCENWYGSQGLGTRIDSVLSLSELAADPKWSKRGNSMRICLNALWSLVYEEGPGKAEISQTATSSPKAYFQVACDREAAVFRLCFQMPGWNPRVALQHFWPASGSPTSPAQLLLRYSDFLRVHTFSNTSEIEITAGYFASAPSDSAHGGLHTLWVEPLADNLFAETPYEAPGPASPRLRPLPNGFQPETRLRPVPANPAPAENANAGSEAKVAELQNLIQQKDALIHELKSGGVGTAAPLPPPDPEALIEAFQERYFDARFQIRQLELEIVAMEQKGATEEEIRNIRLKMEALANREASWIKKLAGTLEVYRTTNKK